MTLVHRSASIALTSLLLVAVGAPGLVAAGESGFKLVLAPVGQPGPFFDLAMRPGETARLQVDLANDGETGVAARTYATDVFTITNGGYGGRLRDTAPSGATTWLAYATERLDLPPGGRTRRSFAVTVPLDAGPGEYITSLVIENDDPVRSDAGVAFDQIVRQAIAVVITVPGVRAPELMLGEARQEIVAGRSTVKIAVENSGNVRLKPLVAFVLRDATQTEISRTTFPMDTFYARTDTSVAVPLGVLLPPGTYTIELNLSDAAQGIERAAVISLVVDGVAPITVGGEGPGSIPVGPGGTTQSLALVAIGLVITLAVLGLGVVVLNRKRRPTRP
jgi:hypothetical protein